LGKQVTGWGIRTLWSSGLAARGFVLETSTDNITYKTFYTYDENIDRDVYSVASFSGRYIRVKLLTTQSSSWSWSLRTVAAYGSVNQVLGKPTRALRSWNHTGLEACDGISSTFWVAEPLATSAVVRVDLQQDFFVGDGVKILWKFPAVDFSVMYSTNMTSWDLLYEVTGNLLNYTEIQTNFVGRYVEIRMTRPSLLNGDGSFAIYSFDVVFDPNLAHGKTALASHTIEPEMFRGQHAIDQKPFTIWMPPQNSDVSNLIIDLLGDHVVSRFHVSWRHAPKVFKLWAQHVVTLEYYFIARWSPVNPWETKVGFEQFYEDGFVARRIKIEILEVSDGGEGKICSLRDVMLHTYNKQNLAKGAKVDFSAEIRGNPATFATDGNQRGTYWMPGEGLKTAWLLVYVKSCAEPMTVARTSLWWRFPPGSYSIEFYSDPVQGWEEVYRAVNQTNLFTDFFKYRKMCQLKLHIYDKPVPLAHDIGLFDIAVYPAKAFIPPAVGAAPRVWEAYVSNINDLNVGTYWMSPPWTNLVNIYIDLGQIYNVYDIFIWFVLLSQGFAVWISTKGFEVEETERRMTSTAVWGRMRLETRGVAFRARYLRVDLFKSFQDPELQLGTSIRDIAVYQFRNLAQSAPTSADIVWSYPSRWTTDPSTGDSAGTYWMAKFGAVRANLIIDLGRDYNIAGVTGEFKHVCAYYRIDYSSDNSTWKMAYQRGSNSGTEIYVSPNQHHFQGRYVRLYFDRPKTKIDHPDQPGNFKAQDYVIGLTYIKVWEHTGGGGAVGIQNLDGTEFNSIVWGQRQPGEWMLGSEKDVFTHDLGGGSFKADEGMVTHIVVTFKKVRPTNPFSTDVRTEIAFYRNGLPYGTVYQKEVPDGRLTRPNQTRLVFGVRSTAFANESYDVTPLAGTHTLTHSPYFWGKVYNVTLIQNALGPEEVLGLYHVTQGGEELGCHCFDACPFGYNRFNRKVPVPCSGQGACLRNRDGIPLADGYCECLPGYSGLNCQEHCSELSVWGCCEIDDDCPTDTACDPKTKACSNTTKLGSSGPFLYY